MKAWKELHVPSRFSPRTSLRRKQKKNKELLYLQNLEKNKNIKLYQKKKKNQMESIIKLVKKMKENFI